MKTYVLDTNPLARFLLLDNPSQAAEVEKLFIRAKTGKVRLVVPQIVIFEIFFTLGKFYNFSKGEIIEKASPLITSSYLEIQNRELFIKALDIVKEYNNLSFADCFVMVWAKEISANLFTFDKKLAKIS